MPDDAPKWTVTAWHCSCHAVEWRRRTPSPPGRPPAPGVPAGVGGGLFWYDTVDEFLADGHRDLIPVDVSNVAALIADYRDLDAELAKTVSNFEERAEATAEALADVRHELEVLRRINRELNDGNADLNQLVLDAQRERDQAIAHDHRQPYPTADAYARTCAALQKHRERADRAEAERDQLRYERRLLGYARLVLDRAAEYHNLHPVDREGLPAEAADIAQRIVDEIGHPVTDEPALGSSYREQLAALTAERDRRGDLLKRAQATVRAVLDIHDDGTRGVCCGQAWPCETVHAVREAATDEDVVTLGPGDYGKVSADDIASAAQATGEGIRSLEVIPEVEEDQAATGDGPRRWALPDGFEVRYGVELAHGPGWERGYAVVDEYRDLADAEGLAAFLGSDPARPTRVTRRAVGPYFPLADATPAADEARRP